MFYAHFMYIVSCLISITSTISSLFRCFGFNSPVTSMYDCYSPFSNLKCSTDDAYLSQVDEQFIIRDTQWPALQFLYSCELSLHTANNP